MFSGLSHVGQKHALRIYNVASSCEQLLSELKAPIPLNLNSKQSVIILLLKREAFPVLVVRWQTEYSIQHEIQFPLNAGNPENRMDKTCGIASAVQVGEMQQFM